MRNFLKVTMLLMITIATFSCSETDESPTPDPIPTASLSNVSPINGPKGTVVTINGQNFGTNQNLVTVFFNDSPSLIQSVNDTEIKVIVPVGALTGLVRVVVDGKELIGPEFTYVFTVNVSTLAGGSQGGFADGVGSAARFFTPRGITADSFGNIYIADRSNVRIRKITPDGNVTTIAGNGTSGGQDGEGINAKFFGVEQVTTDAFDNIYITDESFGSIRKITPTGTVSTFASGLLFPTGIVIDESENIFVADNNKVFKIDQNGTTSILAGSAAGFADGTGTNAQFQTLNQLTIDASGNIFGADRANHRIRKITPNGVVSTIAGSSAGFADGAAISAQFDSPTGITIDEQGNLYVVDSNNHRIRKITPDGQVSTVAGSAAGFSDGDGATAQFDTPRAITIDADGNLYITDTDNRKIRKITFE